MKLRLNFFKPRLMLNFLDQPRFKKFNLNLILTCNIYMSCIYVMLRPWMINLNLQAVINIS